MAAQLQDVLAAERIGITGKITVGDILALFSPAGTAAAQIRNSAQFNLNTAAWTDVPLNETIDRMDAEFVASGNGIQCNFDGWVQATAHCGFDDPVTRISPNIRLAGPAAIPSNVQGMTGYVRNTNGHSKSSLSIPGVMFQVTTGEVVTVQCIREANEGIALSVVGGCYLLLERK